ncbi:MAG: LysE family transporter [Chitinophagaceae bacterium]|nr:MAG: lysine exporter protein LysE/YggA [Bacteroidetes bacterium OLB11]MCC6447452.1 LysE family transporter [Chitinophagaceae bacterium]HMN32475.1 LysE family transporter [Chitinophagaceae bacterium]
MISALIAGLGFGLFMSITVGPTIFAIIKYSISFGWKAGVSFVLGVSFSDIIYVALANLASGFLAELMSHEKIIGYIGSSLFIGIGLYGYFKKIKVTRNSRDIATVTTKDYWKIFSSGFLLNTFNPGVIITWITAVAAISNMHASYRFAFFASCLSLILTFDFSKVILAQKIRSKLTPRKIVYLNRISALCLFGIGVFLLLKIALDIKVAGH